MWRYRYCARVAIFMKTVARHMDALAWICLIVRRVEARNIESLTNVQVYNPYPQLRNPEISENRKLYMYM